MIAMRFAGLLLVLSTALSAQPGRSKLPGEDWFQLFNGKDLSGWTKIGNEKWEVEEGTIHGLATTKDYGYLRTEKNYGDFHLSLKANSIVSRPTTGTLAHPFLAEVRAGTRGRP